MSNFADVYLILMSLAFVLGFMVVISNTIIQVRIQCVCKLRISFFECYLSLLSV